MLTSLVMQSLIKMLWRPAPVSLKQRSPVRGAICITGLPYAAFNIYIYIYIYICMCVCMYMCLPGGLRWHSSIMLIKKL